MSELLPPVQAESIRSSLVDYLTTTFALTDADASDGLDRFLSDPDAGMFKGPYVRLRLPFRPADDGWRDSLEWYEGFTPYGHQAAAFARLSSAIDGRRRRPQPTLVTTGTGSGKTEAFLYPILDHVLRARRDGITGTKALILYPMNALANDQAQRLTDIITSHPELSAVTAALYTGQKGKTRTSVTKDGLITDRGVIRDTAPDILLTNYKMLDQLLLRQLDQGLWRQSATSLQYLVLDEFHTYDGAQGTDVAMLLRRLGLTLKSHWRDDDPHLTPEDSARPLGRITPVATSATLGDKGDPDAMLGFARTVFGEQFGDDSVVTESRLRLDEWVGDAVDRVTALGLIPVDVAQLDVPSANAAVDLLGHDPSGADVAHTVLEILYAGDPAPIHHADSELLLDLSRAHPLFQALAREAPEAVTYEDLVTRTVGSVASSVGPDVRWQSFIAHAISTLGHIRAIVGRDALSLDVHLWIRELTRIDRAASATALFRWGDDGPPTSGADMEEISPSFPALYCRHCGRSGWGVGLAPVGSSLAVDDDSIRRNHATREGRFRALIHAPTEADTAYLSNEPSDGLRWFSVRARSLLDEVPGEDDPDLLDGWILPVLTNIGKEADQAAKDDECPSCGQADGIRFLGSAIATLLSVSLSTLFGSSTINRAEKKALVFTDSVQDAAHRAGFVSARSHTLTFRAVLREAIGNEALSLDELVGEVVRRAGDNQFARYRILAPDCADRDSFEPFWKLPRLKDVDAGVRQRVRRRLALDAALEFGLNSRLGRTLELTGTVNAEVHAGQPSKMADAARAVLAGFTLQDTLDNTATAPDEGTLVRWVRGVLDRMRAQGAIDHPWFERYRREGGSRWSIWVGRPRSEGMPAFPPGRPAPAYPTIGGTGAARQDSGLDPVTSSKSWYSIWTSRVLPVSPADGGKLVRLLLERLSKDGVLKTDTSDSGATVYSIPAESVVVSGSHTDDLVAGNHLLMCDTCRATTPGSISTVNQLDGAPCLVLRCRGHLARAALEKGFYRRLYGSTDMRRVVAREHTSLLDDKTRLDYENGFKRAGTSPDAPNVLVATPTLEMGIDIGDLSAVFLASLPRTIASYLQRVGRAGRLTGNALDLAFVTGRGEHLPKLGDPLSVINGEVRPPATYLQAEEILRRQFTAHLVDEQARDQSGSQPTTASAAIGSSEPETFLGKLIARAEDAAGGHLDQFLGAFDGLGATVVDGLRDWVRTTAGDGTSPFAAHLHAVSQRWQVTIQTLTYRLDAIDALLPDLIAKKESPAATDDDRRALRSAQATRSLTAGQLGHLQGEYWIGVLEEYGVLPNYTLLDDSVVLDVGLSWTDPDSNTFKSEHAQFNRGSAQAIREFAPGATFYARGWEIAIDAVDLGLEGEGVRPWVLCPACGYAKDVGVLGDDAELTACPRCGSTGIADMGQHVDVLELTNVTAEVRRDESTISDSRDERTRTPFQLVTAADVDPAEIERRWFVDGIGLGCTYLRSMNLRWLNMGQPGHGITRLIGGEEFPGSLFRVCDNCGKLDTDAGRNLAREHRPWCPHRTAPVEHTVSIALSRTLRTQGLLIRLPYSITVGDTFAMPSLSAALLLGLREQIGGHPDHIQVERVKDPTLSDGSENHDAILLHDVVPGGTGYLAQMASPERLRDLLVRAWMQVRDCECQHEERLACHRCLLPFVAPGSVRRVSRASAERHLRTLLGLATDAENADAATWSITEVPPPEDVESHLEQRFRKIINARLVTAGAAVTEVPGPSGNTVRFTLPSSPRQWTLTPQVNLENSKPDFLLESTDTNVPAVAIFTDGRTFHATAAFNRLADDAAKRQILRDTGRLVLGITSRDVTAAEAGTTEDPPWFSEIIVSQLISKPDLMAQPLAYEMLRRGPIDWLLHWVTAPAAANVRTVARAVPLMMGQGASTVAVPDEIDLAAIGRAQLLGEQFAAVGNRRVVLRRFGTLAVVVEMRGSVVGVALILDDRPSSLGDPHADAWREWLRISNALALRDWPTVISTTSLVAAMPRAPKAAPDSTDVELVGAWAVAYEAAEPGVERELLRALSRRGGIAAPVVGAEGPDGIPLDVSWPAWHVAVDIRNMSSKDRQDLEAAGWRVLPAEADSIALVVSELAGPISDTELENL